jgi:hypothetical protein
MSGPRYRPTVLLQFTIVGGSLVIVLGMFALFALRTWTLAAGAVVLLGTWALLEMDLLPSLLESWLVRRAHPSGGVPPSRWVVDVEAETRTAPAQRRRDVEDNPAVW